jgi:peptidyl-prolyl cis-trans isomerase B (cyclophilin B)
MKAFLTALCFTLLTQVFAASAKDLNKTVKVKMETNYGNIVLELNQQKAPVTVKNFLKYTDNKFYEGTVFHRVINNFMIQGGGLTADMKKKVTLPEIKNEADNGLKNEVGTIAMARTNSVDSATSQFFINLKDNDFLNHKGKNPRDYGYTVFGKVIKGMTVVNRIKIAATTSKNGRQNVPMEPIVIKKVTRL